MQYDIHLHIWLAGKVVQYHCDPAQSVSSGAVSDAIPYRLHQIYYIWSCFIKIAEKGEKDCRNQVKMWWQTMVQQIA